MWHLHCLDMCKIAAAPGKTQFAILLGHVVAAPLNDICAGSLLAKGSLGRFASSDVTAFDGILPRELPGGPFRTIAIVGEASRTAVRRTRGRNEAGF